MKKAIRLKQIRRVIAIGTFLSIIGICAIGCSDDGGSGGGGPTGSSPSCTTNHTATLTLKNKSRKTTYDVIIDGVRVGVIRSGDSITETVAAGKHKVAFKFSNNGSLSCNVAEPNLAQCETYSLSCSRDL